MKKWGYIYCDQIIWVKQTVNGKIAKGNKVLLCGFGVGYSWGAVIVEV